MNLETRFPHRLTVELTNKCNLNCSFCPRHHVNMDQGMISDELFYKIIDEAKQHLPVGLVLFFRGESLLHPKLIEFIKYAKKSGLAPIQIASNGLDLDENIATELIKSGLDFISFSLDTNNDEIYKKSRKLGDLKRSRENVIKFSQIAKAYKLKGFSVPEIQVSSVDISEYRDNQEEFIDFWLKYADRVRIYIEHSSDSNLGSISNDILNLSIERKPCKKVDSDMVIYWDGSVALCNHDWDNQLNIGNINTQNIKEVWNSETYESIRKMHELNTFNDNITCKNCDHWVTYYLEDGFLGKVYTALESKL